MALLNRLLRAGETKLVKRLAKVADHIDALEDDYVSLSDEELRGKTEEFRTRYAKGETLDELLPEAFAVVREAAKRTLGQRPFPVQVMGGAALHLGNVAEMRTGEGKTLTSVSPVYLNALTGDGVHLVTTNDYLAKLHSEMMGRIHRFLGLSVGVILSEMPPAVRREQYACDVTYGTNNEFGFDYLRDNMAWNAADMVQRGHSFAIVDEADSILIDEARTPLIISGPAEQSARWYQEFARMAPMLKRDLHYEVDERKRAVGVTEDGVALVEDQLGIDNLYEAANTPLVGYLNNALKAKELFKKDKDYIVRDGAVLIVDEFTGRVLAGRRYNEGMHQAIEAKEEVEVQAENQTLATITLQNYFRLYKKLSGMTGTAQTEAAELSQIYKLGVVTIPTNRPMVREDQADLIYKTEEAKFEAVAEDIVFHALSGQPVLVGTTSVEKSEYLSRLLVARMIPHQVLNAKRHEYEAEFVARAGESPKDHEVHNPVAEAYRRDPVSVYNLFASEKDENVRAAKVDEHLDKMCEVGRLGSVTVATNMAGRGTDIMLGGNPEFLADRELRRRGLDPVETREEYEAAWDEVVATMKEQVATEAEEVVQAGGLYVLGTERHESRRIDNQLRGRSGRQGDPGESRFYLSLGDELMRRFNGQMVESIMNRFNLPDDVPIEAGMVTKAIRSAQTQVEQQNFEIRKNVLKYDEVLNKQRTVVYDERRRVLAGENIKEQVEHMLEDVVVAYVDGATAEGYAEDWDLDKLWTALGTLYQPRTRWQDLADSEDGDDGGDHADLTKDALLAAVQADAKDAYAAREAEIDEIIGAQGGMRELERQVLLQVMDRKWREHLYEMDYLKEGIGLRAMAQRDPLIEYQREGFDMFSAMLDGIKEETIGHLFNVRVQAGAPPEGEQAASTPDPEPVPPTEQMATVEPAARTGPVEHGRPDEEPESGGGRHAAPAETTSVLPAAFRGAPVDALSYSGPAEDGHAVRSKPAAGSNGNGKAAQGQGGTQTGSQGGSRPAPSRNRPCPCGSGRKYKQCHGSPTAARP